MQKAAECVASFQVLNTTDPNMINNKNYYLAEVGQNLIKINFMLGIENKSQSDLNFFHISYQNCQQSPQKLGIFLEKKVKANL